MSNKYLEKIASTAMARNFIAKNLSHHNPRTVMHRHAVQENESLIRERVAKLPYRERDTLGPVSFNPSTLIAARATSKVNRPMTAYSEDAAKRRRVVEQLNASKIESEGYW